MLNGLAQSRYTVAVRPNLPMGSFYHQAKDRSFTVASNVYNHFSELTCYRFDNELDSCCRKAQLS